MRRTGLRTFAYQTAKAVQYGAGIAATVFPASLRAEAEKFTGVAATFKPLVIWMQESTFWVAPVAVILVGILGWARKRLGTPWVWEHVKFLLDKFQQHIFPVPPTPGELHHHRVTLFKYVKCRACFARWPWSGWLVSIERSGHSTRRRWICFAAPDDADRSTGVAGRTWAKNGMVSVEGLPDLSNNPSQGDTRGYAEASFVDPTWVAQRVCLARSIYGLPIEVRHKLWGVLVIDSRLPVIARKDEIPTIFSLFGGYLGKLLEKA
jgi:hypothetical protein